MKTKNELKKEKTVFSTPIFFFLHRPVNSVGALPQITKKFQIIKPL
jgi:hypothetical protein